MILSLQHGRARAPPSAQRRTGITASRVCLRVLLRAVFASESRRRCLHQETAGKSPGDVGAFACNFSLCLLVLLAGFPGEMHVSPRKFCLFASFS